MRIFLALFFLAIRPALAFESGAASPSFDEAARSPSYLRFGIPTKKLFFHSHVTGYARKFSAAGKIEGGQLRDAVVDFAVRDLDSDLYARNDQMWNFCLGTKDNPRIRVAIPALAFEEGQATAVVGSIQLRGKEKPLPLSLTLTRKKGRWIASGVAHTSFDALGIPDPSIGVASVDGPIDIEFQLEEKGTP